MQAAVLMLRQQGVNILPAPFLGRDAKMLFKQRIKKSEVTKAGVVGDAFDFGLGIQEQLTGALEAELGLFFAEGDAKFGAEEAV